MPWTPTGAQPCTMLQVRHPADKLELVSVALSYLAWLHTVCLRQCSMPEISISAQTPAFLWMMVFVIGGYNDLET